MLSLLLVTYLIGQIIMTMNAIFNLYVYETSFAEFLNTAVFWPLYLLKNLFYVLLLAFKK